MVKLICLDIDGTLLNDAREVTEETRAAIAEARERGIQVTLATGRMFGGAVHIARELELDVPLITLNGALIKDPRDDSKLRELTMSRKTVEEIIDILGQDGFLPNFYNEFVLYIAQRPERYRRLIALANDPRYIIQEINDAFTYQDMLIQAGDSLQKGILFPGASRQAEIQEKLRGVEGLSVVSSAQDNVELTHWQANKGSAILKLAQSLHINPQDIMAIGDSENDRSMLTAAGWSVAMGNAPLDIRNGARFVTADNNDNGVAKAIRRLALGELC